MTRHLDPQAASTLPPGADHYRAFVGPPGRYDLIGASQFALLYMMGLREQHRLLDIGCGSLRLGRMAIPYLLEGRYFGIEPEAWLIDEGFARELGEDARALKTPRFDTNSDFRADVFGERFDFMIAQSVFSHTTAAMARNALDRLGPSLADGGLLLTNWLISEDAPETHDEAPAWVYPGCVLFRHAQIEALARQCGLFARRSGWAHPALTWYVFARSEADLPDQAFLDALGVQPRVHPG